MYKRQTTAPLLAAYAWVAKCSGSGDDASMLAMFRMAPRLSLIHISEPTRPY